MLIVAPEAVDVVTKKDDFGVVVQRGVLLDRPPVEIADDDVFHMS